MESEKRIHWIDTARGISVILVMLIHSCTSVIRTENAWVSILYTFSISFSVDILFFLAGCSMTIAKEKYMEMSFFDFLKKKGITLLIPYLSYATFVYLFFELMNCIPILGKIASTAGYGHLNIFSFAYGLLIGNNIFSIHVWFLYALFFIELLVFTIWKYIKSDYALIIISLMLHSCVFLFPGIKSLAWNGALRSVLYFALGTFLLNKQYKNITIIISALVLAIAFIVYIYFNIWTYNANDLLMIIIPLMAIIVIPSVSKTISNCELLNWIGQHSLVFYLFQQPFWGSALGTVLYSVFHFPAFISVLICIIASFAMPYLFRSILVKYKWAKFLFGLK